MFRWFTEYRAAAEARQLNRDAPLVITHARGSFGAETMADVSALVRQHIARSHKEYGTEVIDLKRAHFDYKRLHKEARRRAEQPVLSALTLTIIYLRAEIAGAAADPARHAIDALLIAFPPIDGGH
ncbi:MAG: hypothetical protein HQ483_14105 [Rhodospirillales bacterium]|nr:hypothetical protein [Rhodospirillales bacterium]